MTYEEVFLLGLVVVCIVLWGPGIWAFIDILNRSPEAWRASGNSRTLWIVLVSVGMFTPVPGAFLLPPFYLIFIRPQVKRARFAEQMLPPPPLPPPPPPGALPPPPPPPAT